MTDLVAHIREVIDQHAKPDRHDGGELSCSCGATHLSDHSSHVAQAIVNRLELSGRLSVTRSATPARWSTKN